MRNKTYIFRYFVYVVMAVLAIAICFLAIWLENKNGFVPRETESDPTEALKFDFQANGVIIQAESYGKCRVRITGDRDSAIVYQYGKNLWGGKEVSTFPMESKGITFSLSEDGSIIATGTSKGNSMCWTSGKWGSGTTNKDRIFLQEGTYTFSGCPSGGSDQTYRQRLAVIDEDGKTKFYHDYGDGVTFSLKEPAWVGSYIEFKDGVTVQDLRFAPQLEIGDKVTEYEKYRGVQHTVVLVDGVGVLDIELPNEGSTVSLYTFMSTEASLEVRGFGTLMNCVAPIWHASRPHFAIVDDDGKDDVYSVLMPLLNNRGIKFSVSVVPSKLGVKGYLTTDQLHQIAEAGNKIMCHGKNHINLKNSATTYEQRYEEIIGGKKMLEALGFSVDTMVYPNGSYDDEVLEITRSAYKYGVATSGETAWGDQRYNEDPINLYAIERINIGSYYAGQTAEEKAQALEDAKKNIDVCIEKNYLCVIMTHIGDAGEDGIAQIVELIDYISAKGYMIDDFDTAINAHIPPAEE